MTLFRAFAASAPRGRRRPWLTGFARDRDGATAVEVALLALPFFFILFSIIETALMFMGALTLDQAVDRIGRQVRTGQLDKDDMTKEKFKTLLCGRTSFLLKCDKLKFDLRAYNAFSDISTATPSSANYSSFTWERGGPGQIMALRVYYEWPIMTNILQAALSGKPTILLAGVTAFRTEVY